MIQRCIIRQLRWSYAAQFASWDDPTPHSPPLMPPFNTCTHTHSHRRRRRSGLFGLEFMKSIFNARDTIPKRSRLLHNAQSGLIRTFDDICDEFAAAPRYFVSQISVENKVHDRRPTRFHLYIFTHGAMRFRKRINNTWRSWHCTRRTFPTLPEIQLKNSTGADNFTPTRRRSRRPDV